MRRGQADLAQVAGAVRGEWRELRCALGFLTVLPIGPLAQERGGAFLARAVAWFPVVGALIGAAAGLSFIVAAALGLPAPAAALIALATAAALSGGLHEDGLADLADGLGGGRSAADRLRIMRDSRIGSFGALAIVFSIAVRAALLAGMASPPAAVALVAAGALSRAPLPAIVRFLSPARSSGMAADAGRPDAVRTLAAVGIALALAVAVLGVGSGLAAGAGSAIAAAGVAMLARRKLGGHTGDVLGGAQQAAEAAVLAAVVAAQ